MLSCDSGFQAKVCKPFLFLALAWLLSLSACSNAYDTNLGSHTNDILSIGATEIIVYGFLQKFVLSGLLWPYHGICKYRIEKPDATGLDLASSKPNMICRRDKLNFFWSYLTLILKTEILFPTLLSLIYLFRIYIFLGPYTIILVAPIGKTQYIMGMWP